MNQEITNVKQTKRQFHTKTKGWDQSFSGKIIADQTLNLQRREHTSKSIEHFPYHLIAIKKLMKWKISTTLDLIWWWSNGWVSNDRHIHIMRKRERERHTHKQSSNIYFSVFCLWRCSSTAHTRSFTILFQCFSYFLLIKSNQIACWDNDEINNICRTWIKLNQNVCGACIECWHILKIFSSCWKLLSSVCPNKLWDLNKVRLVLSAGTFGA